MLVEVIELNKSVFSVTDYENILSQLLTIFVPKSISAKVFFCAKPSSMSGNVDVEVSAADKFSVIETKKNCVNLL